MKRFQNKYRIESNRAQFWNYSAPAHYFITLCTRNRSCILGQIQNRQMVLSESGNIIENEILNIPKYHRRIILNHWVIMPNHIHCIISLGSMDFDNGLAEEKIHEFSLHEFSLHDYSKSEPSIEDIKQYRKIRRRMLIPKIMGKFKMITSKQINIINQTPGNKNWQRDYHDSIIRDQESFLRISNYIRKNPANWGKDSLYE